MLSHLRYVSRGASPSITPRVDPQVHPFTIPLIAKLDLPFTTPVNFLVGETGTGKSTLLEGLAWALGPVDTASYCSHACVIQVIAASSKKRGDLQAEDSLM